MSNIISTGFNSGSTDGELDSLEADLRRLAELGVETVELGLTSVDLIAGGRVVKERAERLAAIRVNFRSATRFTGSSRRTSWIRRPHAIRSMPQKRWWRSVTRSAPV